MIDLLAGQYGLPEGVNLTHTILVLAAIFEVTVLLRWIPFLFIHKLKDSQFVGVLGRYMPVGVTTVLVCYTLIDTGTTAPTGWWPALLCLVLTIGLHLWRRNATLSILGGTAIYVLLVNLL